MARIPQNNPSQDSSSTTPPPSFTPQRTARKAGAQPHEDASRSYDTRKAQQAERDTPPSFAPRSSRSTHGSTSSHVSGGSTPSQPQIERINPRTQFQTFAPSTRGHAGDAPSAPSVPSGPANAPHTKKRIGTIFARFVIVLLVIILVFGGWLWFWVDGQLNKTFDLTPSSDNSSTNSWLILGSDARDGVVQSDDRDSITGFRTDSILVLTQPKSGPASLISIPRDSYVEYQGNGSKINAVAELYGYQALVSVVEGISGAKIDHVVQIGFDGVATIVDALGTVNLCYDNTVNDAYSQLNWTAGCHDADGTTALSFARMRYSDPEGDIGRAKRQRQVISAIIKKAASPSTLSNPVKAMNVASAAFKALKVDKKSNTASMISMALAFRNASGANGVSGSVYYDSLDYRPGGVGSAIHLDTQKNNDLFTKLRAGEISAGTQVGGYTGA
ncbi:LCP family protein [Alloscardovia venturai]|uniref:LCP family protein n=1 Tax=Alloscardovia venturai TaxID=1769421 RepID=A0ABW2Y8E1_9BIFI